jgi:hypothetical protein
VDGALQYRFFDDVGLVTGIPIRDWTGDATITLSPLFDTNYTVQVRCSTDTACLDDAAVSVTCNCPGWPDGTRAPEGITPIFPLGGFAVDVDHQVKSYKLGTGGSNLVWPILGPPNEKGFYDLFIGKTSDLASSYAGGYLNYGATNPVTGLCENNSTFCDAVSDCTGIGGGTCRASYVHAAAPTTPGVAWYYLFRYAEGDKCNQPRYSWQSANPKPTLEQNRDTVMPPN